ncbi:hypothetical protein [Tunicatimonas pelagia]|uniref:hypothetical protein n=1 Tax=Tunicatimonas pelagia TaxID=931531 RepID=UPI0026658E83|nr:hypothetical protein [Tunicatimonas pelagia]WKN44604.1 hypothetical protein P0M28_06460 [Tunicatimonas pelagia]
MEAYKTKQKVVDRTLTVKLPKEFTNAEVEIIVAKRNKATPETKKKKLAALRKFKGIVKPPFYEPTEDEWYYQ